MDTTKDVGSSQYTVLLNEHGGILDDVIVTRIGVDCYKIVSNAARADVVLDLLHRRTPEMVKVETLNDALLALQGPSAVDILIKNVVSSIPDFGTSLDLPSFMRACTIANPSMTITRCGYTGEDGFEISLPQDQAVNFAELLLKDPKVKLAGLASRDILRLEAGLCLYGHDINEETTPVEAGIAFTIAKSRLTGEGIKFSGFDQIKKQIKEGLLRRRVGFSSDSGPPPREGAIILDCKTKKQVGHITSGTWSPILGHNVAMGYLMANSFEELRTLTMIGNELEVSIRGHGHSIKVGKLPFVPYRYHRP
jgi:aminomethyltransferase